MTLRSSPRSTTYWADDPSIVVEIQAARERHKAERTEQHKAAAVLHVVDPTTFQGQPLPERRWIVPDWVPQDVVTGLYGVGGIGKSLLAQQLMTATALGKDWLGLPVKAVKSLGFFCEDAQDELHRRQADINHLYGSDFADLGNMRWLPRFGEDNILVQFREGVAIMTALFDQLLAEAPPKLPGGGFFGTADRGKRRSAEEVFLELLEGTHHGRSQRLGERPRRQLRASAVCTTAGQQRVQKGRLSAGDGEAVCTARNHRRDISTEQE